MKEREAKKIKVGVLSKAKGIEWYLKRKGNKSYCAFFWVGRLFTVRKAYLMHFHCLAEYKVWIYWRTRTDKFFLVEIYMGPFF